MKEVKRVYYTIGFHGYFHAFGVEDPRPLIYPLETLTHLLTFENFETIYSV